MKMQYQSGFNLIRTTPQAPTDMIRKEPQLFGADADFAATNGGKITKHFLSMVADHWGSCEGIVIDSRSHMLHPGWYPCIPGFHTDDAPRSPKWMGGQPDILHPRYFAEHLLLVLDAGTGSLTEFVVDDIQIDPYALLSGYLDDGENFYSVADRIITEAAPVTRKINSGELISFGWQDWHRGIPATGRGWRYFIRATRFSPRVPENEIRSQVQVYMPTLNAGW